MTDITELAQSLKAAAEKAGRDEWLHVSKPSREVIEASCGSVIATTYCTNDTAKKTYNEQLAESQAKAEFIALANPANILALVEALEKAQQRIAELESRTVTVKLPKDHVEDADLFGWGVVVVPLEALKEACADAGVTVEITDAGIKVEAE
ncbi:ead/Ea22-like family protein [Klebsiella michiganensis]|uniref:ead/Ea22-like family protein n=1 Tax=Klebsiella michiganensis TaxID=1134687 RepID=UPI00255B027A|nr:ead/Ea22-like family protein [Klebsiella michiganensis]MDL4446692.1 ead/Ea22-like family protein [Klebsiella michiganensis]MDL4490512.1 ead/Ea22-like family protein [Klebsiella michiganensis]MDL4659255.1 ead/Ea22-like family protein [Klebsiella michiganensis]